jgi:hypothetical protein
MTRRTFGCAAAIAAIAGAIAVWIVAPWFSTRFTMPAVQPFTLSPGYRATLTFVPQLSDTHLIGIVLDGNILSDRRDAIVGSLRGEPIARPEIALDLTTGGAPVALARTRGRGTNTWDIASFQALRGHAYTLSAEVRDSPPDLRPVASRLFVAVDPLTAKHVGFTVLVVQIIAAAAGITAAVVAIASLGSGRLEMPKHAMERTADRSASTL